MKRVFQEDAVAAFKEMVIFKKFMTGDMNLAFWLNVKY